MIYQLSSSRNFVKEAAKINADQDDIKVGVTFFADLTEEEKVSYHGANFTAERGEVEDMVEDEAPMSLGSVSHKHHYGAIKQQGNFDITFYSRYPPVCRGGQRLKKFHRLVPRDVAGFL